MVRKQNAEMRKSPQPPLVAPFLLLNLQRLLCFVLGVFPGDYYVIHSIKTSVVSTSGR